MGVIIPLSAIGFALVCIGIIIRYVDDYADWEIYFVFAVLFLIAAIICGCFA